MSHISTSLGEARQVNSPKHQFQVNVQRRNITEMLKYTIGEQF